MSGFIQFPNIPGESNDTDHKDWINLLSISESITRAASQGSSGSSRHVQSAIFGDIVCVKEMDKSTPKLIESVAAGTVHSKVKIDMVMSLGDKGKRLPFFQFELDNVIVTSYSFSANVEGDGVVPTESFSLNAEMIKWTYTQYGKDGSNKGKVEAKWDVEAGKNG
ncbi:Hcp family type VI secretion system effector [Bremerella sp. T1]|uniref:Hcp family type VI secretion system effector n=1 Tax=Bremerella sp. TYQ1 TaxID=3119568 RepID=UPI001A60FDBF|nr:type VI secretion system tube protein Hcp [Bremerella volcania]UBM33662.1 type VI secretion system tube protein Hcp [Bremerella volcania]CAE7472588.1 unnamed protein product [Symbiodinium sp. CCMP2456]